MRRLALGVIALVCVVLVVLSVGRSAAQTAGGPEGRYRIAYATYLGGGRGEQAREVIPCPDGVVLVGGQTNSTDFPVTPGCVQETYGGEEPPRGHPGLVGGDCFIVRLSADGSRILAGTYFGGSKQERNTYGLLLDSKGNVVVSSATRSPDLPTTNGCYQAKYAGGRSEMFAAKLSGDLKRLIWCTYVGASKEDWPRGGIALDAHDNVFIVGRSDSSDFPASSRIGQQTTNAKGDAAVVKLSSDGSKLLWATLLGGSDWDGLMGAQVDAAGNVYVAGHTRSRDFPVTANAPQKKPGGRSDAFVAKLTPDGRRLLYATYLGGKEQEFAEHRIAVLPDGSALVPGVTGSDDFPTTPGVLQPTLKGKTDGFLVKVSPDGRRFAFSTVLGGLGGEFYLMPTPDAAGNLFIVGHTTSGDFPVTPDALQKQFSGGSGDGVLAVVSADGRRLLYATYLGGSGDDLIRSVALGPKGEVWLVGSTGSKDFPVTPGAAQTKLNGNGDAFVVKLVPGHAP